MEKHLEDAAKEYIANKNRYNKLSIKLRNIELDTDSALHSVDESLEKLTRAEFIYYCHTGRYPNITG